MSLLSRQVRGVAAAALTFAACASPAAAPTSAPSQSVPATAAVASPAVSARPACPAQTPFPTGAPAGNILYQDDLIERCARAFEEIVDANFTTQYVAGGFRVLIKGRDYEQHFWPDPLEARYGLTLADVRVEVDATVAGGPTKNFYGVACRLGHAQGRPAGEYTFLVGGDGRYVIERWRGFPSVITSGTDSTTIMANGVNRLRADCVGTKLSFYVNGKLLAEVNDAEYKAGTAAVVVRSLEEAGVDVVFKGFSVTRP